VYNTTEPARDHPALPLLPDPPPLLRPAPPPPADEYDGDEYDGTVYDPSPL